MPTAPLTDHARASQASPLRTVLTPGALARLALGWAGVVAAEFVMPRLLPQASTAVLAAAALVVVALIVVCAFGVVGEAGHLAHRLGDPYGTLVLTLSIVVIEVVLIAAVMLGPGEHATIARDSMTAVSMIILGAVIGVCLIVGGRRHGHLAVNRAGTSIYLCLIAVLGTLAFVLPAVAGEGGGYSALQRPVVIVLAIAVYVAFLRTQVGPQAADFREVEPPAPPADAVSDGAVVAPASQRSEMLLRAGLLVATVLPVVLLAHHMAGVLDVLLGRAGAPVALSGLLIAVIVFLPETLTALQAARLGEGQRVINLCHGALVSTLGLTLPTVLVIGALTGQDVVLAGGPAELAVLGVTVLLSAMTFLSPRVTAAHGYAHVAAFVAYLLVVLS